jgi:molybdenum cofactor cytidylyltransferase
MVLCLVLAMNVGAVVLAAEKSARKGQNKQFLKLNGMTIIENILGALSVAGVNEQVVVLGGELAQVMKVLKSRLGKIKIALNVTPELGMASSLQTGLIVLSNVDAVFLVPGDQPILNPEFLKTMIGKLELNPDVLIVSPVHMGKKGHLLLFRRQLFGEIMNLEPKQTIHDVVNIHSDKILTIEAPQWTTMNVDNPEDYKRLKELLKTDIKTLKC